MMTKRLRRRTSKAPHLGDKQHRYGNYRLIELHRVANTCQTATGAFEALCTMRLPIDWSEALMGDTAVHVIVEGPMALGHEYTKRTCASAARHVHGASSSKVAHA
jgi:hypothetical protein